MDHQITPVKKFNTKFFFLFGIVSILVIFLLIQIFQPSRLSLEMMQLETISYGSLKIKAKGFGTFFSRNDEVLSAKISGRVEKVLLYPGDVVKKGQLLLQLSNADLDYDFIQQQNILESQKIQWFEENLNIKEHINEVTDNIEQIELELRIKKKINESNLKLRKKGIVSEINFLKSESDFELALLKHKSLKRKLNRLKEKLENQKLIHSKKLSLELAKYNNSENKINYKIVKSPIDGIVKQINLSKGDEVNLGQTLVVIGSKQPDAAKIDFPQYFLNNLKVGMTVDMKYATESLSAHISRVNPKINNSYVTVEVSLPRGSAKSALIDMNISAEIDIRELKEVYYVHEPSYYQEKKPFLFVKKGDELIKKSVQAEAVGNNYIIITAGVSESDIVLISDHEELENKTKIGIAK